MKRQRCASSFDGIAKFGARRLGLRRHLSSDVSYFDAGIARRFASATCSASPAVQAGGAAGQRGSGRLEALRARLRRDERLPTRAFFIRTEREPKAVQRVSRETVESLERGNESQAIAAARGETIPSHGSESELALLEDSRRFAQGRKYFVETLGCQMNVADSEIVGAVLEGAGYAPAANSDDADVLLVNTCAIREGAEEKAVQKLHTYKRNFADNMRSDRQLGVLGCMAERMKETLLERNLVHVVAGPDAYRDLPTLLSVARGDARAMNVQLSTDETYQDIEPKRNLTHGENPAHAWVSIMRGCNNMCTYCIVPYTRGRERSRPLGSIVSEVETISRQGFKEVTLLGQNVNSYFDKDYKQGLDTYAVAPGFSDNFQSSSRRGNGARFAELLERVALVDPSVRVRFTSPHPKDFTDDVLQVIARHDNICKGIHLPAQSGSDRVLANMKRGYTAEAYLGLVERARSIVGPQLELSSDFISGFCGETEEDHQATLELIRKAKYTQNFMFAYSERERTRAYHRLEDDVPPSIKLRRVGEVNATFRQVGEKLAKEQIGAQARVLIEGTSRRDKTLMQGRTNGLRRCIVHGSSPETHAPGTYCDVEIFDATIATVHGRLL